METKKIIGILAVIVLIVWALFPTSRPLGAASPGLIATVATTSNPTISAAATLFATSTACTARVITTVASPIMLTFSDRINQTPTGTFGHLQAASTTQVYDAELYGCGLFKAFGFTSSALTVTEYR